MERAAEWSFEKFVAWDLTTGPWRSVTLKVNLENLEDADSPPDHTEIVVYLPHAKDDTFSGVGNEAMKRAKALLMAILAATEDPERKMERAAKWSCDKFAVWDRYPDPWHIVTLKSMLEEPEDSCSPPDHMEIVVYLPYAKGDTFSGVGNEAMKRAKALLMGILGATEDRMPSGIP